MGETLLQNHAAQTPQIEGFSGQPDELIALLQYFQRQNGYISEESVSQIARFLGISEASIYGVASFYSQFRFQRPGDIRIRVCQGTACHVQGSDRLSDEIQKALGIRAGETSPDHKYDFEEVACLGCCALASVVEIDGKIYGKMKAEELRKALKDHADF